MAQPEDVFSFATEDAPDQTPAQTSDPDDPLDGHTFGPHALDHHVGLLAPLKTFELQALRRSQNAGVQLGAAGRSSYGGHCATDGGQKRIARVLQEMPTVGNLGRIRKRFGDCLPVSAVSVTSDDFDLRMLTQPGRDRRRLAIRQQVDDGTPFEIADQRSIALSLAPGPVVDPDDARVTAHGPHT